MRPHGQSEVLPATAEFYDNLIEYEGFWYTPSFLEVTKMVQNEFKAEASDIIICSYPRSGTTWLKALTFAIMTRNKVNKVTNDEPTTAAISTSSKNPLLVLNPHACVPFIEGTVNKKTQNLGPSHSSIMKNPKQRILSTHIPYKSLPQSIVKSGCKIIYISRDPKDVLISFWHFGREYIPKLQGTSIAEKFEMFCQGKELYGPIWDHVLEFWKAANDLPEKVLFFKYENLKSQTSYCVRKLAEFLDKPFSHEEEESGQIDKIIELCSLEHLRNLEINKNGRVPDPEGFPLPTNSFFRKGEVGDWKNHLTSEMKERMDNIIGDKFSGTGLNILA